MGDVFGGSTSTTRSTGGASNKWVQQGAKETWKRQQAQSKVPYEAYTGQRVSQANPLEMQAYGTVQSELAKPSAIQDSMGAARGILAQGGRGWLPAINAMTQQLQTGGQGYDEAMGYLRNNLLGQNRPAELAGEYERRGGDPYRDISSYMDPYLEQVLNTQIRKMQESGQLARNQIDARASDAGAFGDARHGIVEAQQLRDEMTNIGDVTGQGYSAAFGNAQQQRNAAIAQLLGLQQGDITNLANWQGQQGQFAGMLGELQGARNTSMTGTAGALGNLQAGQTAETLGAANALSGYQTADTARTMDLANALAGAGQNLRSIDQAQQDFNYQQFLEERGYEQEQINHLIAALKGVPYQTAQTSTTTQSGGGLGTLLGAGVGALV